jgi:phage-related baseplate assembly protein
VLTDTVEVVPCDVVQVDIDADIYLYPETPESVMDEIRQRFIQKFDENRGLGWDLTRSWIIAHLFMDGVQRVELAQPTDNVIAPENACVAVGALNLNLAGRDR